MAADGLANGLSLNKAYLPSSTLDMGFDSYGLIMQMPNTKHRWQSNPGGFQNGDVIQ